MKKLSIITVLFLCLFVCISSVQAIPVINKVEGTIVELSEGDPLGWDGKHIYMEFTIDSDKLPDNIVDSGGGSYRTEYVPDEVFVKVDSNEMWVLNSFYEYGKSNTSVKDWVYMEAGIYEDNDWWSIAAQFTFDYCYLGTDFPTPIIDNLRLSDVNSINSSIWPTHWGTISRPYYEVDVSTFQSNPVPEPTTMLLFGAGLVGLAGFGRKKFKKGDRQIL